MGMAVRWSFDWSIRSQSDRGEGGAGDGWGDGRGSREAS